MLSIGFGQCWDECDDICLPDNDGERKAAHDNPLAIEHLEERRHKQEETKEKKEEVGKELDEKNMGKVIKKRTLMRNQT